MLLYVTCLINRYRFTVILKGQDNAEYVIFLNLENMSCINLETG